MHPQIVAVALSGKHAFAKSVCARIMLVEGLGVAGDAHCGATVQHRSRVARDPTQPNLRQVHLLHAELFDELRAKGFQVKPGDMGENIATRGVDLLGLAEGTHLHIGHQVVVRVTGLRNPCSQIDTFQKGLLAATLDRDVDGTVIRKAGVMAVVVQGGEAAAGDPIRVVLPAGLHKPLACV